MATPIKLQIFGNRSGTLCSYTYGVAAGIYRRYGLDVEYRFLGKTHLNAHKLVAEGDGQFAVGDTQSFLELVADGSPLLTVMGILQGHSTGLMTHRSLNISDIGQMRGRTIAATGGSTALLRAYLTINGIDPSEVNIVESLAHPRNELFFSGGAEGIVGNAINDSAHFEAEGSPNSIIFFNFPSAYIKVVLATHRDIVASDPDLVQNFVRATADSYIEAYANPEDAAQSMVDAFPDGAFPRSLIETQLKGIVTYSCSKRDIGHPFGWMSHEDWEETVDFSRRYLGFVGELDTGDIYTNAFADQNPIAPSWAYEWKTTN